MRIIIGPYKNWIGPYQIANSLKKLRVSEETRDKIGDYLANSWIKTFCEWVYKKNKRKIKIRIDDYDVWNMDYTLSLIVTPMLHKLKECKHGSPAVKDEDVPDEIKSTSAAPKENEWDTDEFYHKRWEYVLDEMIFAFESIKNREEIEESFSTGKADTYFEDITPNETDPEKKLYELKHGSNHTREFDYEGFKKHNERVDNGLRLFGVYFRGLWD